MPISTLKPRLRTQDPRRVPTNWTDDQRIRGRTLQAIRKAHFERDPLCALCLAQTPPRIRVWTILDHRVPLHLGGADDDTNRQGLCVECHNEKSDRELKDRRGG